MTNEKKLERVASKNKKFFANLNLYLVGGGRTGSSVYKRGGETRSFKAGSRT